MRRSLILAAALTAAMSYPLAPATAQDEGAPPNAVEIRSAAAWLSSVACG